MRADLCASVSYYGPPGIDQNAVFHPSQTAPSMQLSCWLEAKWVNLTLVQNQRAIYGDPSRRG